MKKILVPIDFSSLAENAAYIAINIAKKANAQIDFIHIFDKKEKESGFNSLETINKLSKKAKDIGLLSQSFLTEGKSRDLILEHANDGKYDLIIMGSHKVSGNKSLIVKTNAQKIVKKAMVPILVIKETTKELNVKNIAYASTFEEDVHEAWLKVIELADIFEADIHLVYINEPEFFKETGYTLKKMEEFLEKCPRGTCSKNIYNSGYPENGIIQFANENNMDLIALITHGQRGGLRKWDTSLTEWVVKRGDKPVLSVNIGIGDL